GIGAIGLRNSQFGFELASLHVDRGCPGPDWRRLRESRDGHQRSTRDQRGVVKFVTHRLPPFMADSVAALATSYFSAAGGTTRRLSQRRRFDCAANPVFRRQQK